MSNLAPKLFFSSFTPTLFQQIEGKGAGLMGELRDNAKASPDRRHCAAEDHGMQIKSNLQPDRALMQGRSWSSVNAGPGSALLQRQSLFSDL